MRGFTSVHRRFRRLNRHGVTGMLLLAVALVAIAGCDNQSVLLYRLPYGDGTQVFVSRDHMSHTPPDRLDLVGVNDPGPHPIVAAQTGVIRFIVDENTENCCGGNCANNYVWIEHLLGEWTKYSHLATNSVRGDAGLSEGDIVVAGQFLGYESDVGRACGDHLHFEVGIPDDPSSPLVPGNGGFIDGVNRIPRFCGVPGGLLLDDDIHVADECDILLDCIRSVESPTTEGNCEDDGLSGEVCVQEIAGNAIGSTYTQGVDFESTSVKIHLDWCATADCDPEATVGRAIQVVVTLTDSPDPVVLIANCENRQIVGVFHNVEEIIIEEAGNLSPENVECGGNTVLRAFARWEICEINPFFEELARK